LAKIDETARIAKGAELADDAEVGPYCVVGPRVKLAAGVKLTSHVNIQGVTSIGAGTEVYPFASLGTPPQSVRYRGGATELIVGAKCQIRESVTMNTGTEDGGGITRIGDGCFLMAGSHVAHDCIVGNNVIFANNAVIGGHVEVGDFTFFGGHCAVHQHVRIGESVMVAGYSAIREDVIPFGYVLYPVGRLAGLNMVGMRRRGLKREAIQAIRAAYQVLFEGEGEFAPRVDRAEAEHGSVPEVGKVIAFLRSAKRPVMMTTVRGGAEAFE
jgi:UDP-N-acetylglucosamine acyltransferase